MHSSQNIFQKIIFIKYFSEESESYRKVLEKMCFFSKTYRFIYTEVYTIGVSTYQASLVEST